MRFGGVFVVGLGVTRAGNIVVMGRSQTLAVLLASGVACGQLLDIDSLVDRVDASTGETGVEASTDAACLPIRGVCNPFPQCGCGTNENCVVASASGETACVDSGTLGVWQSCTSIGQCKKGMECIGYACKPFCASASDCTGTNVTCEQIRNPPNTGAAIPGLEVCSSGCDPLDASALCGPGVNCSPSPWNGVDPDHGDCFGQAGMSTGPGACATNPFACAPGWGCSSGDCRQWCRRGDEDCPGAQSCAALVPPPIIAGVEYGGCQ